MKTVEWQGNSIRILDQTRLPGEIRYRLLSSVEQVAEAIKRLEVRGAPLIGVTAAYGIALAAVLHTGSKEDLDRELGRAGEILINTRPTAVNLRWAVDRMMKAYRESSHLDTQIIKEHLVAEANRMQEEDLSQNRCLGELGAALLGPGSRVLTICNAGALATCGHGTALGLVRSAFACGKVEMVWACETRPVLQGSRLTVWELTQDGIPVTLITDNMAGYIMSSGQVDVVITGADRIAANGDTANKIGTYGLAVLAQHHRIPFFVAAPFSSIDLSIHSGTEIPIESRNPDEVRKIGESFITLPEVAVINPAFDVTPGHLISAIITERGIARWPYRKTLANLNNTVVNTEGG
ncbi:MAG: S-methyl-5-thioribose-1-phosphate isomerase [Bacillota bacterium]